MTAIIHYAPFLESLKELIPEKDALSSIREKAWARLNEIGLPGPRDEKYKYAQLSSLLNQPRQKSELKRPDRDHIQEALKPFEDQNTLVFYNGVFYPRYSSYESIEDDLVVLPLNEALATFSGFILGALDTLIKKEKDPFALLNLSHFKDALFVYVPKGVTLESDTHIIEIFDSKEPSLNNPFCFFSLGENSASSFTSTQIHLKESEALNISLKFFHLNQHANGALEKVSLGIQGYTFDNTRVVTEKEATFKEIGACANTNKIYRSFECTLDGAYSHAEITLLNAMKGKEEAHDHIKITHVAEHATSSQLVKNLLDEEATSSFAGMIEVENQAQKTDAYQLNQNCLLSDQANAYSRPGLEIFADDVKASHGSTTGQMNPEELFYLESRGLSQMDAKRLLLQGFCGEVIEKYSSNILKSLLLSAQENYFKSV